MSQENKRHFPTEARMRELLEEDWEAPEALKEEAPSGFIDGGSQFFANECRTQMERLAEFHHKIDPMNRVYICMPEDSPSGYFDGRGLFWIEEPYKPQIVQPERLIDEKCPVDFGKSEPFADYFRVLDPKMPRGGNGPLTFNAEPGQPLPELQPVETLSDSYGLPYGIFRIERDQRGHVQGVVLAPKEPDALPKFQLIFINKELIRELFEIANQKATTGANQ